MVPALRLNGREFHALPLTDPGELALPFPPAAYACLLVAGGATDAAFKAALADRLLLTGCRTVACAGAECVAWEYALDDAVLGLEFDGLLAPGTAVRTTRHEEEPMGEVAHVLLRCTGAAHQRVLVVFVRAPAALRREVMAALQAEAAPAAPPPTVPTALA